MVIHSFDLFLDIIIGNIEVSPVFAVVDEHCELIEMYSAFARIAADEDFKKVSAVFKSENSTRRDIMNCEVSKRSALVVRCCSNCYYLL